MDEHVPPASSGHPGRQALIWAVKILVSGGLLYWLFRQNPGEVWQDIRRASLPWLLGSLAIYFAMVVVSTWRWRQLLTAQLIDVPFGTLLNSFLVATFFNNFLPSNIGGDVIRIRDTARPAGSMTIAGTVVLIDRGVGMLGLTFIAACGATVVARRSAAIGPVGPGLLWTLLAVGLAVTAQALILPHSIGRLLRPLERLHQEWVRERIEHLTQTLAKFRAAPRALLSCFGGAVVIQALLVAFYFAVARSLGIPIPITHLAILIPLASIVQMIPVSVNGFGVREQMFTLYFAGLHLAKSSALAMSLTSAAMIMLFSTSGAVAYLARKANRGVALEKAVH